MLIELVKGEAYIQQILPLTEHSRPQVQDRDFRHSDGLEIEWPLIGKPRLDLNLKREIEPHETDSIHVDFIVDTNAEIVNVYTHLENRAKRDWRKQLINKIAKQTRLQFIVKRLAKSKWWKRASKKTGWRTETIHELPEPMEDEKQSTGGKTNMVVSGGTPLQGGHKPLPQGTVSSEVIKQGDPKKPPQATATPSNTQTNPSSSNQGEGNK